jgi:serine/threonine protein kinase/Tfp pilus assembly protein PilF
VPPAGERDAEGRKVFGDFRIIREIGRGGMGVVYEADQVPLGRRVALKVMAPAAALDPRAVQRFQLEAHVAGLLQHPRIVPVYAVGSVGETPYYAMQYVEGGSLAHLIAELRGLVGIAEADGTRPEASESTETRSSKSSTLALGLLSSRFAPSRGETDSGLRHTAPGAAAETTTASGLSIRNRTYLRTIVRLAIQAAEALGHAHDQGIVHRDVKPANLLLDQRGDLWVTDFGMADVQGDAGLTLTGDLPGTLRYMSPEQALGKRSLVDRRTDIYALGATLYELLTLQPAVAGSDKQEILLRIAEGEPAPVRRLNASVPHDLATIVTKALAKDPPNRYETAWQFGDDLGRFLDGRPIMARPVGPAVRVWRWCRRRPVPAGLVAALVLALVAGFGGITWNWREAVRQKREAERRGDQLRLAQGETARERDLKETQRAKAEAINDFFIGKLLSQAEPEHNPNARHVTMLETLDRAAAEVGRSFAGQPATEAAIRTAIGSAYHGLGEFAKSESHYRAAYDLLRRGAGAPTRELINAQAELGHLLTHLGRLDEAEPLLHQATEQARTVLGTNHDISIPTTEYLAGVYMQKGRLAEAESLHRQILERRRRALGPANERTLTEMNNLGTVLERQKRYAEAEQLFRETLKRVRELHGPRYPGTLTATYNLGHVLADLGRNEEAEENLRQSLEGRREVLGPDNGETLYSASRLGALLGEMGRTAEAETMLRTCLESQKRSLGPKHSHTLMTARRLDALLKARAAAVPAPAQK